MNTSGRNFERWTCAINADRSLNISCGCNSLVEPTGRVGIYFGVVHSLSSVSIKPRIIMTCMNAVDEHARHGALSQLRIKSRNEVLAHPT